MRFPVRTLLDRAFPFLRWFPLTGATLRADLIAGITVSMVLVPQSMAYAQLAGLPAYYGLYAAFLPVLIGAAWGSSHQLATGPVAMVSILTASTLAQFAAPGSEYFVALAIALAFMVGVLQLALGLFRLGAIVSFLSHPAIVGFTSAAAIIIGLSQLNKLLGVPMTRGDHFLRDIWGVLQQAPEAHLPTVAMGVGAMALIYVLRRRAPKLPGVLIAVALTTLISWALAFERNTEIEIDQLVDRDARTLAFAFTEAEATTRRLRAEIESHQTELRTLHGNSRSERHHSLALDYQSRALQLEVQAQENENRLRARALRRMHIQLVTDANGVLRAYPAGEAPADAKGDARTWWIQRIGEGKLLLVGGGEVVGQIPRGLPELRVPRLSLELIATLFASALVITLVGFMEAISIAKAMATRTRQRIDPSQELIGQGLANLVGSLGQSYPVSGSFSRSAVNLSAGAKTGMSSVFAALVVLATLMLFTPLLYHLPQAVLAAIIVLAVIGLIDFRAIRHAWQAHRHDGACAVVTFVATLGFAPHLDLGILLGGGLAVVLFLYRTMAPRITLLGHGDAPDPAADKKTSARVVALRFDGPLYFANVPYFEDAVLEVNAIYPAVRVVLVVGDGINEIDASGEEAIRHLHRHLRAIGIALIFSGLKPQVTEVLRATGLIDDIGEEAFFRTEAQALEYAANELLKGEPGVARIAAPPQA